MTNPAVRIGDRIKTLEVDPIPRANGRYATVTAVSNEDCRALLDDYTDADGIAHSGDHWFITRWEMVPRKSDTVTYVSGDYRDYHGRKAVIIDEDKSDLPYYLQIGDHARIWASRDNVEFVSRPTPVAVGDLVKAVNVPLYNEYAGTIVRVTEVTEDGKTCFAEFPSRQKPDDTIRLAFDVWEQTERPITFENKDDIIGRTIRVIFAASFPDLKGTEHVVVDTYHRMESEQYGPKVDGITVGIRVEGSGHIWVQSYELVPTSQPEAPAVENEYVPVVGDTVKMTGYLDTNGVVDGVDMIGTITKVENALWMVRGPAGIEYASGPGYVFPVIEAVEAEPEVNPEVAALKARIATLEEYNRTLMTQVDNWQHDFDLYADTVMREAVERDWCSEYERVMRRIEDSLKVGTIPEREQEFEIEVQISGSVTVTTTVMVTASSLEDAEEMVKDDPDAFISDPDTVLTDNARYNSFDNIEIDVRT